MGRNSAAAQPEDAPQNQDRTYRPIDLVHLAKQCLGDAALELEILNLFDTTLLTYHERLRQAASADELALNLHAIKGAAAGVGAWTVAEMAAALEEELGAGQEPSAEKVDDLALAIEDVRGFIARTLADRSFDPEA